MKEEYDILIQKAYKAKTETNYWNQITPLRQFVNEEMISECFQLIDSDDVKYKQIGIDILCQLGRKRKGFVKELFEKVFEIFETSTDENLIFTSLFAIGHNNEYLKVKQIKALEKFQNSKSKNIRYALTFSLLGIENEKAIKMLINLAQDRSPRVQDWATFGLGTQIETDNEEIRNILYKNCFSKDDQTKQEALKGLANRNDERAKEIILQELKNGNFGGLLFDTILNIKNGEEYISYLISIYNKFKDDKSINKQWLSELKNCIEVLKE
ncbi:hypothetical protein J3D55_003934 [Chryseobacterium ginsenosidimutans]|uniref:HEAT repeat domain-containing protein n=1 Tax=Chryseobacterium ginsenosidimutans TaxID=687846 RepID=UPI00216701AB|nr:HEAT repeat domain-containing protein [Chryseobacterium ginsenosidimutans]MCS3871018.1 hypothetical protein [Chryseobacterium ginsenosidimutans]